MLALNTNQSINQSINQNNTCVFHVTLEYSYVEDQLKELSRPGSLANRSRFIDISSWWSTFGFPFSTKLEICKKKLKIPNR
jgi:hypothetical protein